MSISITNDYVNLAVNHSDLATVSFVEQYVAANSGGPPTSIYYIMPDGITQYTISYENLLNIVHILFDNVNHGAGASMNIKLDDARTNNGYIVEIIYLGALNVYPGTISSLSGLKFITPDSGPTLSGGDLTNVTIAANKYIKFLRVNQLSQNQGIRLNNWIQIS